MKDKATKHIEFLGCPLPPSSNKMYNTFSQRGKIRHVATKELVQFKKNMEVYFLPKMTELKLARETLSDNALSIHCEFFFERSRILTKKGTFKRIDTSNRLKALHDALCNALLIDDSAFVLVSARKVPVESVADEGVDVWIVPDDLRGKVFFG